MFTTCATLDDHLQVLVEKYFLSTAAIDLQSSYYYYWVSTCQAAAWWPSTLLKFACTQRCCSGRAAAVTASAHLQFCTFCMRQLLCGLAPPSQCSPWLGLQPVPGLGQLGLRLATGVGATDCTRLFPHHGSCVKRQPCAASALGACHHAPVLLPCPQIGYQSVLASPVTYRNVITGANIGQRNATDNPYVHFGYFMNSCTPSSSTQCCIYGDGRARYDYWWASLCCLLLGLHAASRGDVRMCGACRLSVSREARRVQCRHGHGAGDEPQHDQMAWKAGRLGAVSDVEYNRTEYDSCTLREGTDSRGHQGP